MQNLNRPTAMTWSSVCRRRLSIGRSLECGSQTMIVIDGPIQYTGCT